MLEHTLGPAIDSTVLLHGFKPACFLLLFLWHPLWLLQPCQISTCCLCTYLLRPE